MSDEGKSKLYSVRVPADELPLVEAIFREFPGVSPAEIFRSLLHVATPISIMNALNRHHAAKGPGVVFSNPRKGPREK